MKSKTMLAGLLFIFFSVACAATLPGLVELKLGQSAGNSNDAVKVTFIELLEDSRCPADAMCVWQGNVKVLIQVEYGTEIQQYTLTLGELLEGDMSSIEVGDYTITLLQVDPYPLASQPTDPADYQVTLEIR